MANFISSLSADFISYYLILIRLCRRIVFFYPFVLTFMLREYVFFMSMYYIMYYILRS